MESVYVHTVQYYETDKMGVVHHSNYIRFMEEARVYFLKSIGWPYDRLEDEGVISPVVSVRCEYRHPSRFAEEIAVAVRVLSVTNSRFFIGYRMTVGDRTVCEGESSHCLVSSEGRPISIPRNYPGFYGALLACAGSDGQP